jgi:hypothetical protein
MLCLIMLNVIMLNVIMLNVIMLNVIILNVIMLCVMAPTKLLFDWLSRAQCYKTFSIRNLRIFVVSSVFVPGRPIQPSRLFVGKARTLL